MHGKAFEQNHGTLQYIDDAPAFGSRRPFAPLLLAGIIAISASSAAHAAYFLPLGDLPGGEFESSARGVSADGGVVVGIGDIGAAHAFRWTSGGGLAGLGVLPGASTSRALGVSADGSVVVGWSNGPDAFRWTAGDGLVALGDLPGGTTSSVASAVSGDGSVIVGFSGSASGDQAFRWTAGGGMVGLGHLPGGGVFSGATGASHDGSVVVGSSDVGAAVLQAFRWTALGGMTSLGIFPGGTGSTASDVNADGSVVVGYGYSDISGELEAFRWTALGGLQGLGDLPGGLIFSRAEAVNADGSVIVGSGATAAGFEASLWTQSDGMRRLQDILQDDHGLDLTDWVLTSAYDVSADGRYIIGEGINPDGNEEAFLAFIGDEVRVDVPAPAALLLLGSAIVGLAGTGDRRSKTPIVARRDVRIP